MREVVCVRARDGVALGQAVEVDDDAAVSDAWFAEAGTAAALRAIADAAAQAPAPGAEDAQEPPQAPPPPDEPPDAAPAVAAAPSAPKGM